VKVLPLSALTGKLAVSPLTSTLEAANSAFDVCPAPEVRWQSRQWHCAMAMGLSLATKRTAPHLQTARSSPRLLPSTGAAEQADGEAQRSLGDPFPGNLHSPRRLQPSAP